MGKMKERMIELMDSGASNLYTVEVHFDSAGKDEYEYTKLGEALAKVEECREADKNTECSIFLKALHLRTMRERYVKKTPDGWYFWKGRVAK